MNYENESLDVINDMENLMQNSNFLDYSDVCLKINESIKVRVFFREFHLKKINILRLLKRLTLNDITL